MISLENLGTALQAKLDELTFLTPAKATEIGRKIGDDMDKRIQAGEATPPSQKMQGSYVDKRGYRHTSRMIPGEETLLATSEYAGGFEGEFVNPSSMNIINNTHVKPVWKNILERTRSVLNMEYVLQVIKEVLIGTR